jgi:hypothetical protein
MKKFIKNIIDILLTLIFVLSPFIFFISPLIPYCITGKVWWLFLLIPMIIIGGSIMMRTWPGGDYNNEWLNNYMEQDDIIIRRLNERINNEEVDEVEELNEFIEEYED